MDGPAAALPLPPSPGGQTFTPPAPPGFAPPAPAQPSPQPRPAGAVGRPSADPEQQEARVERQQMRQRLKNILPRAMTDGRIAVYRLEGRKGRTKASPRPVMTILFQDLEKAMQDQGFTDTGEYIEERLRGKYGDKGRFLWTAEDSKGRAIGEVGEVEVDLNVNDEDDMSTEDDLNDNTLGSDDDGPSPQFFRSNTPPPPPPQSFDPATHARQVREIISEEKKGAESMLTVIITMMQAQSQQQQQQMQMIMQQAEQRRLEEDRKREREEAKEREERKMELERMRLEMERREKDEQRREERERDRRQQEMQMQMQFFQAFMNKPDTMTPMLMKMIESKGDREGTKELFALMGEASRQSMTAQGESMKHMLGAQAEAAKTLIANVMGISQTMVQQMVEAQAEPTDDPMEKVARVFKMIVPALGALNQQPQVPPPMQQRLPAPAQAQVQQQQRNIPPAEYIKGGLYTIMRMETGAIPPDKRFEALKWCAENLPKPMLDAIRSGIEEDVLAQGAPGMDATLLGWIQDEQHLQFLRDCVKDIQRMLIGAMTQADAQASYEKHVAYIQAKTQPQAAPSAEQVIPAEIDESTVAQPAPAQTGKRKAPPAPAGSEPAQNNGDSAPAAQQAGG